MHIVVANLSAVYSGRGDSYLAPYNRIVIVKTDGSVSIHGESGYKPMNYMMAPTVKTESYEDGERVWTIEGKKESLTIYFHEILDEVNLDLGSDDPGLTKESTEHHLQEWLTKNIKVIGEDYEFDQREYQTGSGPVDILARRSLNVLVAVEVKRVAPMNTVGQILRYVDALEEKHPGVPVEGVIAAVEFKDKTRVLAAKKNILCVDIPETWAAENAAVNTPTRARDLFTVLADLPKE